MVLVKMFLINFWGFTRLRLFPKSTVIIIQSIVKIGYIAFYVLLRTIARIKFVNGKTYAAIYTSLTNIVLIPISIYLQTPLSPQYTEKPGKFYRYIGHF